MFELTDLPVIGFLCALEAILSIDNAVVLALLVSRLPREKQKKALSYGLIGAVVFRLIFLSLARQMLRTPWLKLAGGLYLVVIGGKHLITRSEKKKKLKSIHAGFWRTVITVELMDLAFAADSILAAVGVSKKLWVVFVGGMLGVILIRFAAGIFVRLLEKFPNFERAGFLMVLMIGIKLSCEGLGLEAFESAAQPGFWAFWGAIALAFGSGFWRARGARKA